ncbi:DNA-binding domain-containing protein [Endozoicomonas gorgoniicola]|uniref:DNA-binding domain-containing protein n=1 Tax=Endozoicomonas gorgoniicola TaxID=1234144 RepID=A0ABT3MU73_9GAMM|nr:DNA-binding domain-containing protein [Endozoicomonas gorgoniicola]MCW7552927.1 DNA-binding domain-containing protein [Endozoicomonas gorgoniicola]
MTGISCSQSNLLEAIFSMKAHSDFDHKGLQAYQRNLRANARRALSISYPLVSQLLGKDLFHQLSDEFVTSFPPEVGDWGEWGHQFPQWLKSRDISQSLPYIGDCALLNWLQHSMERAANPELRFESFQLLAEQGAHSGKILLNSTAVIMTFDFPVADIWQAHQSQDDQRKEYMTIAREKIQANTQQAVLIWRKHWQVKIRPVSQTERIWLEQLLAGLSLEHALNQLSLFTHKQNLPELEFEQWLPEAIEEHLATGFEL